MIKGRNRSSKKIRKNAKQKIKVERVRQANIQIITDEKWAKVESRNKIEVDYFLDKKEKYRDRYEGVLRKFFYWNFIHNKNRYLKYIGYEDGLKYAEYLRVNKYTEKTIRTHFSILNDFSNYIFRKYKFKALNFTLPSDNFKKRLHLIIEPEEYQKLMDYYINKDMWERASLLCYMYNYKRWYDNIENMTIEEFKELYWCEDLELYIQEKVYGRSLIPELYKLTELVIEESPNRQYMFENNKGLKAKQNTYYYETIAILQDFLYIKLGRPVKIRTMEDFKYEYLKEVIKKERIKQQKREYYHRNKDKIKKDKKEVGDDDMGRETFRKKIVTDELLAQVNKDNIKLMERFLREKGTRCSELTVKNYRSDLNIFFVWNLQYNDNEFFVDLRKLDLSDFFAYAVKDLKWGSARFARMKATLSSLSDFIEKFYDMDYPGFRNIVLKAIENMPKNPVREKTVLTEEQVEKVFEYYEERKEYQKACLFALACFSGARKSELLRFTTKNLDVNYTAFDGIFIETTEKIKTKGRGQSGKLLHKYILRDRFLPHYEKWMKERNRILEEKGLDHEFIFIDEQTGQPITAPNTVGRWLEDLIDVIGVHVYTHSLRHYMATMMARLQIDSELIVFLFGWSSSEMLKIYNDMTEKERDWKCLDKLK